MAYTVTCYTKTGCNGLNIPDSPDKLAEFAGDTFTLPALDILQAEGLPSVRVKIVPTGDNATDYKHIDYVKIGSYYYAVNRRPYKVAVDVVELSLTYDGVTTHGGPGSLTYLDGLTVRCSTDSDEWGQYDEDDPFITPQKPLKIKTEWLEPAASTPTITHPDGGATVSPSIPNDYAVLLESTIDLPLQAYSSEATLFTDDDGTNSVTIPKVRTNSQSPTYYGFEDSENLVDDGVRTYIENDEAEYTSGITNASKVINLGITNLRAIGVEQGSIINQWRVPLKYIGEIKVNYYGAESNGSATAATATGQYVNEIKGKKGTITPTITPNYYEVKNKRLLYGKYNNYGIITTSGSSGEFKPEEITTEDTAPEITYEADVRPKGKPYFRFTSINGNSEFWRNCLPGSEWQNVPLVYQGSSGSALNTLRFQNDQAIRDLNYEYNQSNIDINRRQTAFNGTMGVVSGIGQAAGGVVSLMTGGVSSGINSMIQGTTSAISSAANMGYDLDKINNQDYMNQQSYQLTKNKELSELAISNQVYVPTVNFPYNADILRDVKGNSVLLYKYEMSDADLSRLDKILTMYGYKNTRRVTKSIFSYRTNFDYVEAKGISIGGDMPMWEKEDIAAQLSAGVRVWHVKPDPSIYTSGNPIATEE